MKKYITYRIARPIIKIFIKYFYKAEIIDSQHILNYGRCLLVGNHTNNLDPLLLITSTKRTIRFMAKKEIHKGILKNIFLSAGTISVDRQIKDEKAKSNALKALQNEELLCIFPEGTINRTKKTLLEFKYGAVSFAYKTKAPIVPFIIKGKYKIFRRRVKIKFLKPYYINSNDLQKENKQLMNIIKKELESTND